MKKLQQGDVIIRRIKAIPAGSGKVSRAPRGFVLAEGEATGHAHVIEDDVELFEKDGVLFIRAERPVTVTHEEHKPIALPSGTYAVSRVREYDPFRRESRAIRD